MKRHFVIAAFTTFLSVASTVLAQSPGQVPPQQSQPGQNNEATTLVGCLTKGGAEHQYVITEDKTSKKVLFSASERIEPFLNQTVELTGQTTAQEGGKAFVPQSVKTVATTCTSKQ
jgi:hypothetical protein